MNILEIKGTFVSMIAQVDDEKLLQEMLQNCLELLKKEDNLSDLPPEILQALEEANADDDMSDSIPNDAVFQQFKSWQKQ